MKYRRKVSKAEAAGVAMAPHKWLMPIAKSYPAIEAEYKSVATKNKGLAEPKTAALAAVYNSWRAVIEVVATSLADSNKPQPIWHQAQKPIAP